MNSIKSVIFCLLALIGVSYLEAGHKYPKKRIVNGHIVTVKPTPKAAPKKQGNSPKITSEEVALQKALLESLKSAHQKKKNSPKSANNSAPLGITFERVTQQEGATCGYHALYNAWRKVEELEGNPEPDFPLEEWRELVVAGRIEGQENYHQQLAHYKKSAAAAKKKKQKCLVPKPYIVEYDLDGELIDDGEIAHLAQNIDIDPTSYTIIPNVTHFIPALQNLNPIKHQLRTVEGTIHAFILGNMDLRTNSVGHWIAIVAHRINGRIRYYVMDSVNGKPVSMVNALRNIIEPGCAKLVLQSAPKIPAKKVSSPKKNSPQKFKFDFSSALMQKFAQQQKQQKFAQKPAEKTMWQKITNSSFTKKAVGLAAAAIAAIGLKNLLG